MSAKYEPLKTVVAYFLDQYDKSSGDQDKYWLLSLRGLENMHYNISAEPKTVRLPVLENDTVPLPADYVNWVKIGLLNNIGEISTLKINNALTTFRDLSPDRLSLLTPDLNDSWVGNIDAPYLNYYNNGMYQTLFGSGQAGLVQYGSCRVDEKNNIVVLEPNFEYSHIMFEYISSPEKDSDYLVDIRLREALISWIAWKSKLDTRENYYGALTEANRMIKPIKMQSFQEKIRINERFTLKV